MEEERDEASTLNKGPGRIENRRLVTTTLLNEHLGWPGVKQVCQLTRTTTRKGSTTTEVAYGITSVGHDQVNAAKLLQWQRGHWGIENKDHWVRDEQLRLPTEQGGKRPKAVVKDAEDRCRVRIDSAPQVLAGIRNLAMNWLRSLKVDNIAQALRENAWQTNRLFAKLGRWNQ